MGAPGRDESTGAVYIFTKPLNDIATPHGKIGGAAQKRLAGGAMLHHVTMSYDIDADKIATSDLHIHLPQGAVKKDGPSAGVALTVALVSALTGRTVRNDIAITGEVNLRGRAMP